MKGNSNISAIVFFGTAVLVLGLAFHVPYWSGDFLNLAAAPTPVQNVIQAGLIAVFFGLLITVMKGVGR